MCVTMRGHEGLGKNSPIDKALARPYLSQFLGGADGLCDLRQVI
jgi:hypothetical protein